jgi:hypothetical protein
MRKVLAQILSSGTKFLEYPDFEVKEVKGLAFRRMIFIEVAIAHPEVCKIG